MADGSDCVVRLRDGRQMSFADIGSPVDPVVIYAHGNPGSRLDCCGEEYRRALADAHVRLVAPDRPGFGGSDGIAGTPHVQCATDVAELAEHLGISRFAVLGYSRGGLHALACGALLPDRVTAVGVLGGLALPDMPGLVRGVRPVVRAIWALSVRSPALARALARRSTARAHRSVQATRREYGGVAGSPIDRHVLEIHGEDWHRTFVEALRRDAGATVDETRAWLMQPLGFDPEKIAAPVRIWHGADDRLVPVSHAQHLARRLPASKLEVVPRYAHMHTPQLIGTVVSSLVPIAHAARPSAGE